MSVYFRPLEISDLRLSPSLSDKENQRRIDYYYRQKEHEQKLANQNYVISEYHAIQNRLDSVNIARPNISYSHEIDETDADYYPRITQLLTKHLTNVSNQRRAQILSLTATYRDLGGSGFEELSSYASPEQIYERLNGLDAAIRYIKAKKEQS
jgi:hypothetical protein